MTKKLSDVKNDKEFTKSVAHKALSDILGKAGKPKSIKLKIKFGGKESKKKRPAKRFRAPHTPGIK